MDTERYRFVSPGALVDAYIDVVRCTDAHQLRDIFRSAQSSGRQVALMSGQRSFHGQCLPVEGGIAIDMSACEPRIEIVDRGDSGRIWVRVSGGTRFFELKARFPGHRVLRPPTSDHISVAGALSACSHKSTGFFADGVRAFRLLTPTGELRKCSAEASGLDKELYFAVPGAFGALGVVMDMELELHPMAEDRLMATRTTFSGSAKDGRYLDALEETKDDPTYPEGAGALVYGKRGHAIVAGVHLLPASYVPRGRPAVLTGDNLRHQAFAHALANRYPRVTQHLVRSSLKKGTQAWAPWYGLQYYQRSYDRIDELLTGRGLRISLARVLGVDKTVPVLHQAWFFPRKDLRGFMDLYFGLMDEYPGIEHHIEQQDLILLPPSRWPAHSTADIPGDSAALTSSFSIARVRPETRLRIIGFLRRVSSVAYRHFPGTRVSLAKQIHCNTSDLRSMHASWIDLIFPLRKKVDPHGILMTRHLQLLLQGE